MRVLMISDVYFPRVNGVSTSIRTFRGALREQGGKGLTIISTHPLSEDRLARMSREDQTAKGPPLLTDAEWQALKGICGKGKV